MPPLHFIQMSYPSVQKAVGRTAKVCDPLLFQPGAVLLMLLAQEVVDRLHGIERGDGHFDKEGVPVGHGSIPQSGQFKSFQFLTVFRFVGDKSRLLVDILRQVKFLALAILYGTYQVDGVEVCRLVEHGFGFGILQVDLRTFEYLR